MSQLQQYRNPYRRKAAWRKAKEVFEDGGYVRDQMEALERWFSGRDPREYLAIALHHFLKLDARGKMHAIETFHFDTAPPCEDRNRRPALVTLSIGGRTWTVEPGSMAGAVVDENRQRVTIGHQCDNETAGASLLRAIDGSISG